MPAELPPGRETGRETGRDTLRAERPARRPLRHLLPRVLQRRVDPFKPSDGGDAHRMRANNKVGDEPVENDSMGAAVSALLVVLGAAFIAWVLYMLLG